MEVTKINKRCTGVSLLFEILKFQKRTSLITLVFIKHVFCIDYLIVFSNNHSNNFILIAYISCEI